MTEATNAPTFHFNPTNGAKVDVTKIESTTPRSVFEGPNSGLPSRKSRLPSTGAAKALRKTFAAITGVPLATVSRAKSWAINHTFVGLSASAPKEFQAPISVPL